MKIKNTDNARKSRNGRSRIPLKTAFKIGCGNFKLHPAKIIATILLAVFSFTFLGITLVLATFDKTMPYVNAVFDNGYEYLPMQKYISFLANEDRDFAVNDLLLSDDYNSELSIITDKDMEILQNHISEKLMIVILKRFFIKHDYVKEWNDEFSQFVKETDEYITRGYSGYMTLTEDIIKKYDYELVGRLPQHDNEVVICEQHYNTYKYLGYKDKNGNEYEIKKPEDMLGHVIDYDSLVVTGILKTGCDRKCYIENHREIQEVGSNGYLKDPTVINSPEYFSCDDEYLFHEKLFVTQDYIFSRLAGSYYMFMDSYVIVPVPQHKKELNEFAEFITSYNYQGKQAGEYYEFSNLNPTSNWYNSVLVTGGALGKLSLCISLIFLIFSMVFLLNFIATSLRSQMKQIGIISALGADFKQLYKIYVINALIVCGTVYILSLLMTGIIVMWFNSTGWRSLWFSMDGLAFKILSLNFVTIIIMFIASIAMAILGTLIPLYKMRKLYPAEIMRRGQVK